MIHKYSKLYKYSIMFKGIRYGFDTFGHILLLKFALNFLELILKNVGPKRVYLIYNPRNILFSRLKIITHLLTPIW